MIEIIDLLDEQEAPDVVINEKTLEAAMQMISTNLFRTFANKSKYSFAKLEHMTECICIR